MSSARRGPRQHKHAGGVALIVLAANRRPGPGVPHDGHAARHELPTPDAPVHGRGATAPHRINDRAPPGASHRHDAGMLLLPRPSTGRGTPPSPPRAAAGGGEAGGLERRCCARRGRRAQGGGRRARPGGGARTNLGGSTRKPGRAGRDSDAGSAGAPSPRPPRRSRPARPPTSPRATRGPPAHPLAQNKTAEGRSQRRPRTRRTRHFLRTTTLPIEYPAPNEQITPTSPDARSPRYSWKASTDPAEAVLA